ncbi:MAG TPA: nuclear transport factor 2 family protein [Opitutaceae bacterium]|nr:nuclear transport factor 2 family protein [Opitutaceae bacterium]
MTTSQIATQLVELCRRGDYLGAQRELYAADAVSIEPEGSPTQSTRGLPAIQQKTRDFETTFEAHGGMISDPVVADPFFACTMSLDVTQRASGRRITLSEVCVYEVKDGKIIREQFFYRPRP